MKQIKIGDNLNNLLFRQQTGDKSVEIEMNSHSNKIISVFNIEDLQVALRFIISEGETTMDASRYAGLSEKQLEQLQEIATTIGTTINELLEKGSPDMIIEQYSTKKFGILND